MIDLSRNAAWRRHPRYLVQALVLVLASCHEVNCGFLSPDRINLDHVVVVDPPSATIVVGERLCVHAVARTSADGEARDEPRDASAYTWSSQDAAVVKFEGQTQTCANVFGNAEVTNVAVGVSPGGRTSS